MRGRIVFIHPETHTGLIFGADRERYNFELNEWSDAGVPPRNLEVKFQIRGDHALKIKPYSLDDDDDMLAELLGEDAVQPVFAEEVPAAKGKADKRLSPTLAPEPTKKAPLVAGELDETPAAEFGAHDEFEDDFPTGLEDEDKILSAQTGGAAPLMGDRKPIPASRLLFEQESPRRPTWKFYLIGVMAAVLLILIALVAQHFMGAGG